MEFRALACALAFLAVGVSAANCGSDDDTGPSVPTDDGGQSSGFVPSDGGDGGGPSGSGPCVKRTCADLGVTCGPAGDGCGGAIECGACTTGTCGGGGVPSVCGGPSPCQPTTCEPIGVECGPAGDGCGGKLECGACEGTQRCGFGGPSKCGGGLIGPDGGAFLPDGGACVPRTTCQPGECGPVADGCGGLLTCGGCTGTDVCGAVTPSRCGTPTCTPLTCAAVNADCGFAADGCGGLLNCGGPNACDARGQACGLGGPNRCGTGEAAIDAGQCQNFCVDQVKNSSCAAGSKTTISGTVYAPNGKLPIPNAFVYVPNGSRTSPFGVQAFTDGTATGTCDQCSIESLGQPLVATRTGADGTFRLENVPPETDFPVVIQLGRWRRLITVSSRTRCTTTALTAEQTRFAKRQNEGSVRDNIPLIAISTGAVDGLECVLYKLGIEASEFGNPAGVSGGGTKRIRLYRDNDTGLAQGGARIDDLTPRTDEALTSSADSLNQYDAVIFGCAGAANNRSAAVDERVRAYADHGGRVFATHFNYTYIADNGPWSSTVKWDVNNERVFDTTQAQINTSFAKGLLFSQWLAVPLNSSTGVGVGALTNTAPPLMRLVEARNNADLPTTQNAQYWMTRAEDGSGPGAAVFHYTFNTPIGAPVASQCGRVLYSDFHVSTGSTANSIFPAECGGVNPPALTQQEKALAFFLFDLTSCIQPDLPAETPVCKKLTCAQQNVGCGKAGDGCGGELTCNTCPGSQVCQGNPPACTTPTCSARDCASQGAECGVVANGCGATVDCGACPSGETCGGDGPNKCGSNTCAARTCQAQNIQCGPAGDGCGGLIECGACAPGLTCGGGGVPNVCGAPACTKRTCAQANAECGPIADGCGGLVQCGTCPEGSLCGFGGTPNRCGVLPTR